MSDKKEIVSASPKVRKLAREFGADIYQIEGSQREGRVSEDDVKSYIKDSISGKSVKKQTVVSEEYDHSEFGEVDIQQIPRIKKIAGPHLEKSWSEIPHVTQHDEADIKDSISGKSVKKQTVVSEEYDHSEFGEVDIQQIPRIKKIAGPHLEKSWSEIPHVTQHDEADIKDSISGKSVKKQTVVSEEYDHSEFGEVDIQQIPRIKKIAGPHLEKSWSEIPHVTQHDEADITEMEKFRKTLRDLYTGEKISITPLTFIIRAVVKALKDYPNFNASLDPKKEKIIYKKYFHIGIAVDTPHGLMVPKIRDADKKDITELGRELKKVTKLCKELKIDKKEFFGGSITISSLGSIGGSFFTPIINQPEVAILGIGRAETKQVFMGDKYENRIMLPLSLSYDHRVIDGVEGARFCVHLKESLGKDFAYKLAV